MDTKKVCMQTSHKPSRNDLCPCGSGKKFKKCCLLQQPIAVEHHVGIPTVLQERLQAEKKRIEKFGDVRPVIHADFKGHKFVAVGSEFHHSKEWRTFLDFLEYYIKRILTPEWGNSEIAKPFEQRHEIMKWYDQMCRFQQKAKRGQDGLYGFIPNGPTHAYLLLAYDLYTLQHHSLLQAAVIRRLKHKNQFQGARHELFATATCIRAGYDIEYEDERDSSRKHPEFIATHRKTGLTIAVEAKSRHRPGVLGYPGQRQSDEAVCAGIRWLFKDALDKSVAHPYVIFFDLNLPPIDGHLLNSEWFREAADTVVGKAQVKEEHDPFNLIVFSNQPDHYVQDDAPAPPGYIISMVGRNPRIPATYPEAIRAIHDAAQKFGMIPNTFEEAD